MKALKIIFMGTPAFALPALDSLILSSHMLIALVAPPDRPYGRGEKVRPSPVKEWALKHSLELKQPEKITGASFISWVKEKAPDLIVTVAFGKILPPGLLELPSLGCINLHASYLPYYRGSAPIHRAVIDGAEYSGVSIIKMSPELDAGDIIIQEKEEISPFDTAGMLHDRLALRGASLLVKAVDALASGTAALKPQDHTRATYAPPLGREDERLDWNCPAIEIYNRIRGLNPWPGAYTVFEGKRLKVWRAVRPETGKGNHCREKPGTIMAVGEDSLTVATADVPLKVLELQPAGKKHMDAGSFCCGYRIKPGCIFSGEQRW